MSDYLDDRTHIIISGYIRNAEQLFFIQVPSEITATTLLYVDDHFMFNRGSYQWTINDPKSLLSAQHGDEFLSDIFDIAKLKWICLLYPNGEENSTNSIGFFELFLELLCMPSTWDHINILWKIECCETNTTWIHNSKYNINTAFGWPLDTLSLSDVATINPNKLRFIISIKILRIQVNNLIFYQSPINNYNTYYKFKWKISNNLNKKSRIFSNIIGEMFCVQYNPEQSNIMLRLCGLPATMKNGAYIVDGIQVKWMISVQETNAKYCKLSKLDFSTRDSIIEPAADLFEMDQDINLFIEIEILNEYDSNGGVISSNAAIDWLDFVNKHRHQNNDKIAFKQNDEKSDHEDGTMAMAVSGEERNAYLIDTIELMVEDIALIKSSMDVLMKRSEIRNEMTGKLQAWLIKVGLDECYDKLIKNGFDTLDRLRYIDVDLLDKIGIDKIGHRIALLHHIKELHNKPTKFYQTKIIYAVISVLIAFFAIYWAVFY